MPLNHSARQSLILNLLDEMPGDLSQVETPSLVILARSASVDAALLELIASRKALCTQIKRASSADSIQSDNRLEFERFRCISMLDALLEERTQGLADSRSAFDVIESDDRLDPDRVRAMLTPPEDERCDYDVKRDFKEYGFIIAEYPAVAHELIRCLHMQSGLYTKYIKEMGVHCARSSVLCDALHQMLTDEENEQCKMALEFLIEMPRRGGRQAAFIPRLLELMDSDSKCIRELAIDALSSLGSIARRNPRAMERLGMHADRFHSSSDRHALARAFNRRRLFSMIASVDDYQQMIDWITKAPDVRSQIAMASDLSESINSSYLDESRLRRVVGV